MIDACARLIIGGITMWCFEESSLSLSSLCLGKILVGFAALQLTVWCRGMEITAKDFPLHCNLSKKSELYQQSPFLRTGLTFGLDSREDRNICLLLVTISGLHVLFTQRTDHLVN